MPIPKLAHGIQARQSELREFRNQDTVRNLGSGKEEAGACGAAIRGNLFTPISIQLRSQIPEKGRLNSVA